MFLFTSNYVSSLNLRFVRPKINKQILFNFVDALSSPITFLFYLLNYNFDCTSVDCIQIS